MSQAGRAGIAGRSRQSCQFSPVRTWQRRSAEMSSFEEEMERSSPTQILSSTSAELTTRSMEICNELNHQAVVRFLSRFSVPVADIIRDARDRGLDASLLEGHMAALNSIPMMRLVAADVMSLAEQLKEMRTANGSTRKHAALPAS
jgi:ribosome modulation factor